MNDQTAFNEANKAIHVVENEWHFPILTALGFIPFEKTGEGFVRGYTYEHAAGFKIRVNTGVSSDYWNDITNGTSSATGYWGTLEAYAKKLIEST